jgi:hypothetical protein
MLAEDLRQREVYLEDELALTHILRRLEADPMCHLTIDREVLAQLQRQRSSFDQWASSNKALAKEAGIAGNPPRDNRVSGRWTQYGTWTGRICCSEPPLQAIGADDFVDLRPLFRAADGFVLLSCDWRRAELQALAKLCRQEKHNTPGWAIFEPLPEKGELYRILYGGGSPQELAKLPPLLQRCIKDISNWLIGYNHGMPQHERPLGNVPLASPWCEKCSEGHLCQLCGREKPKETPDTSRQINWMLQASVAGAMRMVLPFVVPALEAEGAYPLLLKHDEIVVQVPKARATACKVILEAHMGFRDEALTASAKDIDERWGQWDTSCSTGKTLLELSK